MATRRFTALFLPARLLVLAASLLLAPACTPKLSSSQAVPPLNVQQQLRYCEAQARKAAALVPAPDKSPRHILAGEKQWTYVSPTDWTSGFWPGILWQLDQAAPDKYWQAQATAAEQPLPVALDKFDHDLGFMFYCSYGRGYQLTRDPAYKQLLLRAADSLATLFNPRVGTILSWPAQRQKMNWPHNTIMDNMMNLELLFWAAKNGGPKAYYDMAVRHAETTRQHHFRPDGSSYHVAVYDDKTGQFLKGVTHQGYADNSMWARGQAWAIYGFTMAYRESGRREFLETAQRSADIFLRRLPADHIPYWDFDAPNLPNTPKDASAAAITASALLELSTLTKNAATQRRYRQQAEVLLGTLSAPPYLSGDQNNAFLLHSTGHKPKNSEVDASIIYADYYYLEALLRLQKLQKGQSL